MSIWVTACIFLVGVTLFLWEKGARHDAETRAKTAEDALLAEKLASARAQADLAFLRSEAERLNHELSTCNVPGAARQRLDRLLGGTNSR